MDSKMPLSLQPSQVPEILVREELHCILNSESFRGSKRCQMFLQHVVDRALAGEHETLKERLIGHEIFHRPLDYDTDADAIVRVTASEVRKRLLQHYSASPNHKALLSLPRGCYVPEWRPFREPASSRSPAWSDRWRAACLAGLALILLAWGTTALTRWMRRPVADDFWMPAIRTPKPVLLCLGRQWVYLLSDRLREKQSRLFPQESPEFGLRSITLAPTASVQGKDIIPIPDRHIDLGSLHTAVRLSMMFTAIGKPVDVKSSREISLTHLGSQPSVLIGAFNNRWSLEMTKGLRFTFDSSTLPGAIRDRHLSGVVWRPSPNRTQNVEEFAVISRLVGAKTGEVSIVLGGIMQHGTRAAGEFVTDRGNLAALRRMAPSGWGGLNMQVVIRTRVIDGAPTAPEIVASHFW